MDYPQNTGLSSLMANYGNISQGMNPGQQPSFGGNQYFPGMPSQVPSYQPQDWGGFAPGQLSAQYGTGSTYGTQDGLVNYGYGQKPVVDYAKQLADQQAAQAAADQTATAPAAQNIYAQPNPMMGGQQTGSRYGAQLDGSPSPAMSPVETSVWARAHPYLAMPGQFLSSLGMMVGQPGAEAYNNAFHGYTLTNPSVEDRPALHPESDDGVRDSRSSLARGGITSLLR